MHFYTTVKLNLGNFCLENSLQATMPFKKNCLVPTCSVSGVMKVFSKSSGLMLLHPFSARAIIIVGQNVMIVRVKTRQNRTSTGAAHWRGNKAVLKLGTYKKLV